VFWHFGSSLRYLPEHGFSAALGLGVAGLIALGQALGDGRLRAISGFKEKSAALFGKGSAGTQVNRYRFMIGSISILAAVFFLVFEKHQW
jgi:hypothetical protein